MKKLNDFILMSVAFFLPSCTQVMDWQTKYPDSILEELAEDGLENFTGYDLDLTPITGIETQSFDLPIPFESTIK